MRNIYIKCSLAQGVDYTTSFREAGIGPEASGLIKLNRLGGDYHPLWDDSKIQLFNSYKIKIHRL